MLRRCHPAKSGTGRPWTVARRTPTASQPPDAGRWRAHARPSSASGHVAWATSDTTTGFFFFLISQTTRVRLHGKPFSRPSSCLQHLHSVGARCGGGLEPAQGGRGDLASERFASPARAQRGLRARMVRAAGGGGVPAHEAASSGGRAGDVEPRSPRGVPRPQLRGEHA